MKRLKRKVIKLKIPNGSHAVVQKLIVSKCIAPVFIMDRDVARNVSVKIVKTLLNMNLLEIKLLNTLRKKHIEIKKYHKKNYLKPKMFGAAIAVRQGAKNDIANAL